MDRTGKIRAQNPTARPEAEALDTLNARISRKPGTKRLIEADIEAKAKKRRREQRPATSGWKK